MMKLIISALAFASCAVLLNAQVDNGDEVSQQNSESNIQWWKGDHHCTIRLHDELTLQDCLDAGIRPRHVPGLAESRLQFQAKSFVMILPNGHKIICENGYGELSVSKDYRITTVAFYEEKFIGFERCRERLIDSNKSYEGKKTVQEIDAFLNSARVAEDHWTGNSFAVGRSTKELPRDKYWLSYLEARNRGRPDLPFRFIMRTEIRSKDEKNAAEHHGLGVLLTPPKGYEDISFTYISPPSDPSAKPILTPLEQAKLLSEKINQSTKNDSKIKSQASRPNETKTIDQENPSRLPWIGAGVLLITIFLLLFNKLTAKRQ